MSSTARRISAFAISVAAAVSAAPGFAQPIYRSVDADGEVTYSSQPMPNARESAPIHIPSLSPEQRRAAQRLRLEERALSAKVSGEVNRLEGEWRRVDREIVSAQKELARSEAALQQGRVPLPGERRGNAGGGSRLTEAYFQRLRDLEARVEQAKQRLDQAYAARNALK